MKKSVLSILIGLLSGFVVVAGFEYLGHYLYPMPKQIGVDESDALKKMMENAPVGAMFMVLLAHLLGSAVAVFVSIKIAKKLTTSYVVAILFFLLTISNLFMIPHPTWFTIADVLVVVFGIGGVYRYIPKND